MCIIKKSCFSRLNIIKKWDILFLSAVTVHPALSQRHTIYSIEFKPQGIVNQYTSIRPKAKWTNAIISQEELNLEFRFHEDTICSTKQRVSENYTVEMRYYDLKTSTCMDNGSMVSEWPTEVLVSCHRKLGGQDRMGNEEMKKIDLLQRWDE